MKQVHISPSGVMTKSSFPLMNTKKPNYPSQMTNSVTPSVARPSNETSNTLPPEVRKAVRAARMAKYANTTGYGCAKCGAKRR